MVNCLVTNLVYLMVKRSELVNCLEYWMAKCCRMVTNLVRLTVKRFRMVQHFGSVNCSVRWMAKR